MNHLEDGMDILEMEIRLVRLKVNKNYYVVRNAGCVRSRYTLKLSLIFIINESMNELINRVFLIFDDFGLH